MTQSEIKQQLEELKPRLEALTLKVDLDGLKARMKVLETDMARPDFWDGGDKAQKVVKELSAVKGTVASIEELLTRLDDIEGLYELASEEREESLFDDAAAELTTFMELLDKAEIANLLNGPYDEESAFLTIYAGAGGTDASDWAEMLGRMYLRWGEKQGHQVVVVDRVDAEEAGVRHVTFNIKGHRVYGYLKAEVGVHRLVRISPFDAKKRRHTSFAAVDVIPDASEDLDVEVNESDLKIDTYRASGAGGQHVNVTDSAVRITHLPTGLVVQCQNERSQHSNKSMCMKMLKARLLQIEEKKREDAIRAAYDDKGEIAWGNQIRSYVLHPYTMAKDHRTLHEAGNVQAVLDGDIMPFIDSFLRHKKV